MSMVVGHLAAGTVADQIVHLPPWVDGASGFVLMSGLVLGMVQPGRIARGGLRSAEASLLRRARLLYVAHISTVALAFVAAALIPWDTRLPRAGDFGGVFGSASQTLLLRVNPSDIDILSMYVLLLLLAGAVVPLLAAGRTWTVVAASVALWALSLALPGATTLPRGPVGLSKFNWGAWQALFVSGLVVGWHWTKGGVASAINSRRACTVAVTTGAGVVVIGVVFVRARVVPAFQPMVEALYDKNDLGPARLVLAWVAFTVLYVVLTRLGSGRPSLWLRPIEVIGQRSLDSFLILTVVSILLPVLVGRELTGVAAMATAAAALVLSYSWALVRARRSRTRARSRSVHGPVGRPRTEQGPGHPLTD